MPHQKSSDYKETAVQYYLVEDNHKKNLNKSHISRIILIYKRFHLISIRG